MDFYGTFEHALDAKNRLTVPAKFRDALKAGVMLAISPETELSNARSLAIWRPGDYSGFVDQALAGMNPLAPRTRDLRLLLYANAWDQELDAANRLVIPPRARELVGLQREVVITGAGDHLELWDRASFLEYNNNALARFAEITARFDHTD